MFFFNRNDVPVWLIYPLKTVNLAEIVFLGIMYYQLNQLSKKGNGGKSLFPVALVSYIFGLMFWVVALVFWQMTNAN